MEFKTILVFVDAGVHAPQTLGVAFGIAAKSRGHVIGMHVRPRFQPPAFTDGTYAIDSLFKAHEANVKADAAKAVASFKTAAVAAGQDVTSEWRVTDGFADDELAHAARYADLVVVGQRDPDATVDGIQSDLAEHVAMSTERPVLVVPHVGASRTPGKKVLLAWNGSREASRAATAALPLLAEADKVVVLSVDPRNASAGNGTDHAGDACAWLARHGVKATVQHDSAAGSDIGSVILSRAADHDADLIVMGVYGHSRMREMVLGGVSRTMLASMTAPLLIAH
jgi:nucleotide-binding universal stress UspA family protein